jgi:hypothetical protein
LKYIPIFNFGYVSASRLLVYARQRTNNLLGSANGGSSQAIKARYPSWLHCATRATPSHSTCEFATKVIPYMSPRHEQAVPNCVRHVIVNGNSYSIGTALRPKTKEESLATFAPPRLRRHWHTANVNTLVFASRFFSNDPLSHTGLHNLLISVSQLPGTMHVDAQAEILYQPHAQLSSPL